MKLPFNYYFHYILLFLLCISSRLLSTIYYIEDPESLRFTLGVINFDLSAFYAQFPGFPVFCCLARVCYYFTDTFSIAFSILGGLSLFVIIVYSLKLLSIPLKSLEGALTAVLLFLNPMIWIASNKFMPDLLGVALLITALYYLVCDSNGNKYHSWIGYFLVGLLAGVRLSYTPFLFIPIMYSLLKNRNIVSSLAIILLGVLIWFIPMLVDTGWEGILHAGNVKTQGHISYLGGTMYTESNLATRIIRLIQGLWAEGLGAYWPGRNWVTVVLAIAMLPFLFFGTMILLSFDFTLKKVGVVACSCFLYGLWILLFQNIVYYSRHILTFIPFLLIILGYGLIYFLVNFNNYFTKITLSIFLLAYGYIGIRVAIEHKKPTAIAQLKNHLAEKEEADDLKIVSVPRVNFYLANQGVKAHYYSVKHDMEKIQQLKGNVIVVGKYEHLIPSLPRETVTFTHDPYINRIWPKVTVSEYSIR